MQIRSAFKSKHALRTPFNKPMICFYHIVEILTLSNFNFPKELSAVALNGFLVHSALINIDYSRVSIIANSFE